MVAGIAVDDIEIFHLAEIMFGRVCREYSGHARIKPAAEYGCQPGLLKLLAIGPLPRIFEMGYIARLVVGCVEVAHSTLQTCIHYSEILIGERHVYDHVGLMATQQCHELLHRIGIDRIGCHVLRSDLVYNSLTLRQSARSEHYLAEHLRILGTFVGHHRSDATGADDYYF